MAQLADFSGRVGGGSTSASCHFMGRAWRIGAIRRMTSPPWKRRTVPVDWLTTTARERVTLVIAAAAQWRGPPPLGGAQPGGGGAVIPQGGPTGGALAPPKGPSPS